MSSKKEIVDREKKYTNEELFDEVIDQASGDDWDGAFTKAGLWEFNYLLGALRGRLSSWMEE